MQFRPRSTFFGIFVKCSPEARKISKDGNFSLLTTQYSTTNFLLYYSFIFSFIAQRSLCDILTQSESLSKVVTKQYLQKVWT